MEQIKNRIELAKYFNELGFTKGAEIGVFAGHFSDVLLQHIPGLELSCIDYWGGYDGYRDHGFESLDFVYIDANHEYKFVVQDIEASAPKVRKGGIVAGHDYYVSKTGNDGVIRAVNEFIEEFGYELQLTSWDKVTHIDHDDRQPSWFFIR